VAQQTNSKEAKRNANHAGMGQVCMDSTQIYKSMACYSYAPLSLGQNNESQLEKDF
jgi:hypothetical protein